MKKIKFLPYLLQALYKVSFIILFFSLRRHDRRNDIFYLSIHFTCRYIRSKKWEQDILSPEIFIFKKEFLAVAYVDTEVMNPLIADQYISTVSKFYFNPWTEE